MPRRSPSHSASALLAVLLALAVACRGNDAAPARRTIVDSRDTYDPRSLDPALSTDVPTGRAVSYVFDGLTRFTPNARVEPALSERWEVTPDGRTYTMHLRHGVRFQDGRPFRAENVVASWTRVLDPATRGGRPWPLFPIHGARAVAAGTAKTLSGVAVLDDSTVRITLDTALAIFPKLLAMPAASIVPDSVAADFGQHPVGTGPWKLVTWKHDDYLLFARNADYFGGAPKMDSLMARIVPDPSTGVAEFESGRVDLLYIPETETRRWTGGEHKGAVLASAPALRLWYVAINTKRGPLADKRVRKALNLAVDRATILDRLMGNRGRLAAGVVPPSLDGADTSRAPYAHDIAAAKKLLADAGFPNGIDVELWHATDPNFARVAQAMQSDLAQAGIRAKIVQRDAPSVREAARKGSTDLHLKDWYADYPDAENFLYPLLFSGNAGVGGNESFYANPEYDRLVSTARREQNDAARSALYVKADAIEFDDAPMIYLFFYNELYALQPWVKNFRVPTIFNGQRWIDVTIEK